MDKYIGNKKVIVDGIESFLNKKGIKNGMFIDAFAGTTNVSQYFKQKGYSIICNDINEFSYAFGKVYVENNSFPNFKMLFSSDEFKSAVINEDEVENSLEYIKRKINSDKLYDKLYYEKAGFEDGIRPLINVLQYLNGLDISYLSETERLFFDYYCVEGSRADYKSARGTTGKRNYFLPDNAKKLGKILAVIKRWKEDGLILKWNVMSW